MAQTNTTDAEIVTTLRALDKHGGSANKAAEALGINEASVRRHKALARQRGLTAASAVITETDRLREDLRQARAELKRLLTDRETDKATFERSIGLAARVPEPPSWMVQRPTRAAGGIASEIPVLFVSDIHHGETVVAGDMAGTNAFNREISKQRLEHLFRTAVTLIGRDLHGKKPKGVVLALGGDMITGDIHEELEISNDGSTTQALDELTDIIAAGIALLADAYGRVFIPCVVGNHGRNTKRWRAKGAVYTSYEWLMYRTLERHFRADKRITFFIPGEVDAFFKVNGKRFLLTHGDRLGVKGGDGIIGAIGPIMRGTVKLGTSERQIGRDFDYLMMGHWHFPLYLPVTIVNGCVKGYDEYARLGLRVPYAPASQMLFYVHPTHGLTIRREVILQDPLDKAAVRDHGWVEIKAA